MRPDASFLRASLAFYPHKQPMRLCSRLSALLWKAFFDSFARSQKSNLQFASCNAHTQRLPQFFSTITSRCNVSCSSQHTIASQTSSSDFLNSLLSTSAFTSRGFLSKCIQFACDTFTQMVSSLQHAASRCGVCLFSHARLLLFFQRLMACLHVPRHGVFSRRTR